MKSCFHPLRLTYTGQQLHSHFAYETCGLMGDSIVAFTGPAEVREHLVDLEDKKSDAFIRSPEMLHFIVEHFGMGLSEAVVRQRFLIAGLKDLIGRDLARRGDDLMLGPKKLSVSIATVSPVSALIHVGLNIRTEGAPVPAAGLADLSVDPKTLAEKTMGWYIDEHESMALAKTKVKGVM